MTTIVRPARAGWLRSAHFDLTFVVGVAAVGIVSGGIVAARPELFRVVLICDLWLLAYHHVIATYTRLCFDLQSARANRFLLVQLPPIVIAAVLLLYFAIGAWAITTLYLYWQWWHYTRQSYGVGQIYKRKAPTRFTQHDLVSKAAIYLLPLWGIVHRSNQGHEQFLGLDVRTLAVPAGVETFAAIAAGASIVVWSIERVRAARRGEFSAAHTLHMLSHWAIFAVGYIVIDDIDAGWITINVWHNAQYVLFVWLFNTNRFAAGVDAKARFLSALSQRRNMPLYFATIAGIGILVYATTTAALTAIGSGLPLILIVYQAVNFHHYIVDSRIWKVRKKPLQQTLRLQTIDDAV
jgi:hypothetical protein